MAVALRGALVAGPAGNPTTGGTLAIGATVAAGDWLELVFTSRDHTVGTAMPTVTDNDSGGNTWTVTALSTDRKHLRAVKRATSATASKTITIAGCVGSCSAVLAAWSGTFTGGDPTTNMLTETNASANETHASITPTNAGSMIRSAISNYANDNAVTSPSWATLGAATGSAEKLSTGGSDCATHTAYRAQVGGPAAVGAFTWAQADGTTYSSVWALRPAVPAVVEQTRFRFRNDDGNETGATWKAAENTDITLAADVLFRLRIGLQETGGNAWDGGDGPELKYSKNGGGWTSVGFGPLTEVAPAASANVTNAEVTTKQLSGTGTFESGEVDEDNGYIGGTASNLPASGNTEHEYVLTLVGTGVTGGDTIEFRLEEQFSAITAWPEIPMLTVGVGTQEVAPDPVAIPLVVPVPVVTRGALVNPAPVPVTLVVPVSTVTAGRIVSPIPATIPLVVPTPVVVATRLVSPSPVVVALAVPTPTVTVGALATPSPVAVVLSVPVPTVQVGRIVSPSPVPVMLVIPAPVASAGALVLPDPVAVVLAIPVPTVSAGGGGGSVTVTPDPVAVVLSVPVQLITAGSVVSPTPVTAQLVIPSPVVTAGARVVPDSVVIAMTVPVPAVIAGRVVSPAPVVAVLVVPVPVVTATGTYIYLLPLTAEMVQALGVTGAMLEDPLSSGTMIELAVTAEMEEIP